MKQTRLLKCPICGRLIGDNEQTISMNYGFGDHMPVIHELTFHYTCTKGIDVLEYMIEHFEMEDI